MKVRKNATIGVMRLRTGYGTTDDDEEFEFSVTVNGIGAIVGMPVVRIMHGDGSYHEVVFELDDVLGHALSAIEGVTDE